MTRPSLVELHKLVDVVGNVVASPDDDPVPCEALEVLRDLVGAHAGGYCEAVATTGRRGFECVTRASPPWLAEALEACGRDDPTHVTYRHAEERPVAISDLLERRAFEATDVFAEVCRPLGTNDSIRLYLRADRGLRRYLFFDRDRRGFGRRERTLLSLAYAPLSARRTAAGRAGSARGSLTRREAEVLELLACGRTNKEIAARLVLSPHTVRTHLEHSFRKLGVNTRTEAALTFLRFRKDGRKDEP